MVLIAAGLGVALGLRWHLSLKLVEVEFGEAAAGGAFFGLIAALGMSFVGACLGTRHGTTAAVIYHALQGALIGAGGVGLLSTWPALGLLKSFILVMPAGLGSVGLVLGRLAGAQMPSAVSLLVMLFGATVFALAGAIIGAGAIHFGLMPLILGGIVALIVRLVHLLWTKLGRPRV